MRISLHKIFKEMQNLSVEERELVIDTLRNSENCKRMCKDLGVKFSDKKLVKYLSVNNNNNNCQPPVASTPQQQVAKFKKIQQIIMGDNLDMIEEAAKKKGLI